MLSSHLRLGLRSGLFPSDFSTKIMYTFLIKYPSDNVIRKTCLKGRLSLIPIGYILQKTRNFS
jgi:hypothetical protein